jgi:hypothetical protein
MKAHTFTDTTHCVCICTWGLWCGFNIFPVSGSVKCSVPSNAGQQCFPEFTNFGMAQRCFSKDQLWQRVRWRNVQHTLNLSSVCSKIVRHVSMCFIGLLQMISITMMASRTDSGELVLISFGLKVVVYLPFKDIVVNDVTSCIFLIWMNILRHGSVCTCGQPWDFSYGIYLPSCS